MSQDNYAYPIFTVEIDGKPIVAFEAKNQTQAQQLLKESWFQDDLLALKTGNAPLWDGKQPLRVRKAIEAEVASYRGIAAEAEEAAGDIVLAFLVPLDGAPR
jgi:hypothetical protein